MAKSMTLTKARPARSGSVAPPPRSAAIPVNGLVWAVRNGPRREAAPEDFAAAMRRVERDFYDIA